MACGQQYNHVMTLTVAFTEDTKLTKRKLMTHNANC